MPSRGSHPRLHSQRLPCRRSRAWCLGQVELAGPDRRSDHLHGNAGRGVLPAVGRAVLLPGHELWQTVACLWRAFRLRRRIEPCSSQSVAIWLWQDYFWASRSNSFFEWGADPTNYRDAYHCYGWCAGNGRYSSGGSYCGDATASGSPQCYGWLGTEKCAAARTTARS